MTKHAEHCAGEDTMLVQAAANELMAAEAEKAKWQSSINEVIFFLKPAQPCLPS